MPDESPSVRLSRASRPARIVRRAVTPLAIALLAVAAACGEDRDRLDVPRVYVVLDTDVVAPGDTVRGRIYAGDSFGGILRLAVRICIDSGFPTARLSYDRADSAAFGFKLPVPATTPENALVIVEGQVSDDQNFFVEKQDTIVARSPGGSPGPSPLQPTCAR